MAVQSRRAAHFTTNFLPYSQTFIYQELIHHKRYEMEAFCHTRYFPERFPFERVHAMRPVKSLKGEAHALAYLATTYSRRFMKRIREGKFDLVHAQFGPGGVYALPYCNKANLPLIVTFGGYDVPLLLTNKRFRPEYWLYWGRSQALLKRIDRFLPVSQDLANGLMRLGVPAEKIRVFHRGVRIPEWQVRPPRDEAHLPSVLMIGRFVEKKGFEYGIEGFARAVTQGLRAELRIIGAGDRQDAYERILQRYGVKDRVHFLGQLPQDQVFEEILKTDLLMVPSVVAKDGDTEGIPNVLKEANARGVPALASRHGGIPEIMDDGRTGVLTPERDVEAIAQGIMDLLSNLERLDDMGRAAREKMKQELDIQHTVDILETHYDEVIEEFSHA